MANVERRRAPKRTKRQLDTAEAESSAAMETEDQDWVRTSDANTPFGLLPASMQTYFREINTQLAALPDAHTPDAHTGEAYAEDAQLILHAALSEMDGSELVVATDPSCSLVLENMVRHMDARALRILLDRMAGSYVTLAFHRYGSHALQALLAACQECLNGEVRDEADVGEAGTLRSLPELLAAMFDEMEPALEDMLSDAFASHVLRSLVALFSGVPIAALGDMRSKRSEKYRAKERRRGTVSTKQEAADKEYYTVPSRFLAILLRLYQSVAKKLTGTRLQELLPNTIAAPALSLLLRLESGLADGGKSLAWRSNSLTARVLGVHTADAERTDFMEAALRDTVATHVLQSALAGAAPGVLAQFWDVYIAGRVAKLGAHPCANFVVASAVRVLPGGDAAASPLAKAVQELAAAGSMLVKRGTLGVLQAAVERTAELCELQGDVIKAVNAAFRIPCDESAAAQFVPVVLSMRTWKAYAHTVEKGAGVEGGGNAQGGMGTTSDGDRVAEGKERGSPAGTPGNTKRKRGRDDELVTTQGSVLLQTLCRLLSPHQDGVYISLAQNEALADWCRSPTAAHVVLAALAAPSASFAQRRAVLKGLLPMLVTLGDDAWGSRVADAAWLAADGFTKNKIAQLALEHEKALLASPYGRFFVRRLRLGQYRKDAAAWREWVTTETVPRTAHATATNPFAFLRAHPAGRGKKKGSAAGSGAAGGQADTELAAILAAVE
ncbi:Nucleolar protein 9 [Malassezia sp. CBS 17886]|nr:Nucleolar protein 9 [Malassezia sp. CBS 17886]